MAVITRAYSETDGNIAYASSINRVIDDLYTLNAGNIGTTNLANSGVLNSSIGTSAILTVNIAPSAITTAKVAGSAITTAKVAGSAITTALIADSAIIESKLANSMTWNHHSINVGTMPSASLWVTQRLILEGF